MVSRCNRHLFTRLLDGCHRNSTKRLVWRALSCAPCLDSMRIFSRIVIGKGSSACKSCHSHAAGRSPNPYKDDNCKDKSVDIDNMIPIEHVGQNHLEEQKKTRETTDMHIPVLKDEVLSYLGGKSGQCLLDMTFGAGGHTRSLLDSGQGYHIYTLDRDPLAYKIACELAEQRPGQITPLLGRFTELPVLLAAKGVSFDSIDGALFDLGSSSMQFDQSERGFSISMDGPLDMRMDADRLPEQPTAADVVNTLDEKDLAKIFRKYGEDTRSKKFAHAIVEARSAFGRITRTKQLADIIQTVSEGALGRDSLGRYTHPATKIFQALRIFVNNEMNELNNGLEVVHRYLKPGGICVAISFHSLEDRIVKRHFNSVDIDKKINMSLVQNHRLISKLADSKLELDSMIIRKWRHLNKKVTIATDSEVEVNPRSRSAKLRAAVKLEI